MRSQNRKMAAATSGSDAPPSLVRYGRGEWGGFGADLLRASPGLHRGVGRPETRLLFYLTEGVQTQCACEGVARRRALARGEFDLVPAGASGWWEDQGAVEMLSVRLGDQLIADIARGLGLPARSLEVAPVLGDRDPRVAHVAWALAAEVQAPSQAGRLYADGLACALAARILQRHAHTGPRSGGLSRRQATLLEEFIEANLDADLSLKALAQVVDVSVAHLNPLFRRALGQSPHRYVVERRVIRARDLLLEGRASVAAVAAETGFAHQSHLARWMRRILGVTPSQVRNAGR